MPTNCSECEYATFGEMDPMSDICDGCMNDPDIGWGGFTDHRVDKHFSNEKEQEDYYKNFFDSDGFENDEME